MRVTATSNYARWSSERRRKLRLRVASRDNWICCFCNGEVTTENWSTDHKIPASLGGTDDIGNLRLAHKRCNDLEGTKLGKLIQKFGKEKMTKLAIKDQPTSSLKFNFADKLESFLNFFTKK